MMNLCTVEINQRYKEINQRYCRNKSEVPFLQFVEALTKLFTGVKEFLHIVEINQRYKEINNAERPSIHK